MTSIIFVIALAFSNVIFSLNGPPADDEVEGVINRTTELAPGSTVVVRGIEGPVSIETTESSVAEIHWRRLAKSKRDLDCETIDISEQPGTLEILHRTDRSCHIIQAHETLKLILPRSANLKITQVEGSLVIADLDGRIDVRSVEGAFKAGYVRAASVEGVEGDVSLGLIANPEQDLSIRNIEGDVDLTLPSDLHADIKLRDITGRVNWGSFAPSGAHTVRENAFVTFGNGGRTISVTNVEGSLSLRSRN